MSETAQNISQAPRLNRALLARVITVAAVILAGAVVMNILEKSLHLTFDKPAMPLRKPLAQLATQFGPVGPSGVYRYTVHGPDERMSQDDIDTLGTNKYLLRTYSDTTKKDGDVGALLMLNLNYYDTGTSTPHVPEICWASNGLLESPNSRQFFMVKDVPHRDGRVSALRMRMISFEPTQNDRMNSTAVAADPESHLKNVAYLFEVNGKYVASPEEVRSTFWKASNKYAYETKIEVTVPALCTQAEAQAVIGDYIRAAIPQIEECLPDSSRLTGDSQGVSGAETSSKKSN